MDLEVGRRIRDLRRARNCRSRRLLARTDLSIGFVSQIERGLSSPSLRVLATLADVLGVGIAALFGAKPERRRRIRRCRDARGYSAPN